MKSFFIITLFTHSLLLSQQASFYTQEFYSLNRNYHIIISGNYYEGFRSNQQLSLLGNKKDTIWSKTIPGRSLKLPTVSNVGGVAVPSGRSIQLYDRAGNLKGIYNLRRGKEYIYGPNESIVHGFSPLANRYFVFLRSRVASNTTFLICLNDSAAQMWRDTLDYYEPSELLFYGDKTVVCDCGFEGIDYTNYCYVFGHHGAIIWQHQRQGASGTKWQVTLDESNGDLSVKDGSLNLSVNLNDL